MYNTNSSHNDSEFLPCYYCFPILAYFIVEQHENGHIRLHNNYNYLAFEGKQACIMSFVCFPIEKFQLK